MDDSGYMRRALELAARGEGAVSPRPAVGAVVVSANGEVLGEGCTHATPGPHAEVAALRSAGEGTIGSTVYVSLEPCCRSSVSQPCAEALIAAKVARVVAATRDPNPDVNGRGLRMLRAAGIDVRTGVLSARARALIEPFAKWIGTKMPLVTLKLATTLDGKTAAPDGTSRWITGPEARAEVHDLRRRVDAVLVGAGTVEIDDPSLAYRIPDETTPQPLRVVVDSSGRTPTSARVFDEAAPTLIVTSEDVPEACVAAWRDAGAGVASLPAGDGGVELRAALAELARRGVCHVLCEGGPTLAGSLVEHGLVDRFLLYVAPKLIGGEAPGMLGAAVKTIADAWDLEVTKVGRAGDDLRIEARPA